jgi:hypothetical protein
MKITSNKWFRVLLLGSVYALGVLGIVASGGGGSGGGDDDVVEFPTPTLPAGARTIDAMNAEETADLAVLFIQVFASFPGLKAEAPSSIPQAIKLVIDQVARKNRNARSLVAGKTEDVSADFGCSTGTVILNYDENTNSASGKFTFSECDIDGSGIFVNGTMPFEASWNDSTLDYRYQFGSTLTFDDTVDLVTIVLNFIETGNEGTGDFALTPNFSLDGIPDGGFLVTTEPPLTGDIFVGITGGQSIVEGASNTLLCMLVTAINELTVDFDDGLGGGCVPLAPPLIIN